VRGVPESLLEDLGIDPLQRDLTVPGEPVDLADARIVAPLGYAHGGHALGMLLEHRPDGVKAVNGL
jgi:hypothetical protein